MPAWCRNPLWILMLLFPASSYAVDRSPNYQLHLRAGLMQGTYSGANIESRTFSVPTSIDIEMEAFLDRDDSFTLRAMMAMETANNRVNYTYAGAGRNYYFLSRGRKEDKLEKSVEFSIVPKQRYYWGFSVGIAQVLAVPFGLILSAYSTTIDASLGGGMIHQLSSNMGLDLHFGVGMGYGFSTVTVTGFTARGLVGVTYFF